MIVIPLLLIVFAVVSAAILHPRVFQPLVGKLLKPFGITRLEPLPFEAVVTDAPLCSECGSIMTRNGSCYKCGNCGGTSGCS